MTLLHQAAQKAVEARDDSSTVRQINAPDAGPMPEICDGMDKAGIWSYAHLCGYRAALQQQPEPVACPRCSGTGEIRSWGSTPGGRPMREVGTCPACGGTGEPPALQYQEVPREPVARMVALDDGLGTVFLQFLGERPPAGTMLYASPSTTRQQEVGSRVQYRHKRTGGLYAVIGTAKLQTDKPLFDMAEVVAYRGEDGRVWVRAAAEFDERFERAAAPSTPENADGVGTPGEGQQ